MSLRAHILGSGSRGNSILIESAEIRILVDAGLSGRQIERRLEAIEIPAETVSGVVITHEHRDHVRGMGVFARRWRVPLYLTRATAASCAALLSGKETLRFYRTGEPLDLGDLRVEPFLTCHDAVDPVAVTLRHRPTGLKVGVATDLGTPTLAVRHALRGSHLLILEANHDDIMLREGPYPWSVKSRIAGRHGHLSNRAAAQLGQELSHPGLCGIALAHLSQDCNDPQLAADVVGEAMESVGCNARLWVAGQDEPTADLDVAALHATRASGQLELFTDDRNAIPDRSASASRSGARRW